MQGPMRMTPPPVANRGRDGDDPDLVDPAVPAGLEQDGRLHQADLTGAV
jgi:hypothetical protein